MNFIKPIFILGTGILLLGFSISSVQGEADGWSAIAPGIDYQVFPSPTNPYQTYVARMDRSNPNVFIESSLGSGALTGPKETVRQMASRYDEAINFWGASSLETSQAWGGRNHVVVAINGDYEGDYYDKTDYPYFPEKGVIHSGWYDKRFPANTAWTGFAWKMNRTAFVGECVTNPNAKQFITFANSNRLPILSVNMPRLPGVNDQLVVYTPDYGPATLRHSTTGWVEVVVQMAAPTAIIPDPHFAAGTVISVSSGQGATPIPFDAVVLSGSGTTGEALQANAHPGEQVNISQEIGSWDGATCKTNLGSSKDWTKTYAAIGGAFAFLQNGTIDPDSSDPAAVEGAPRTAIALNDQYIFFIVTEGVEQVASQGGDQGMSFKQLGEFAKNTLGATWGIAQDGGGSSTMWVNGQVVNHPSDCKGSQTNTQSCERALVNGIMMVVQEPMVRSDAYQTGDTPVMHFNYPLRLGPGTNYASLGTLPGGTQVTILDEPHGLNGVFAKYSPWWKVQAGDQTGWISWVPLANSRVMLPTISR